MGSPDCCPLTRSHALAVHALGMERPLAWCRGVLGHPASPQPTQTCRPTKRSGRAIEAGTWTMVDGMLLTFLISPSVVYRSQSATSCHRPASVGQRAGVRGGFVPCPYWGSSMFVSEALCINHTSPPRHRLQFQPSRSAQTRPLLDHFYSQALQSGNESFSLVYCPHTLDAQEDCISELQRAVRPSARYSN